MSGATTKISLKSLIQDAYGQAMLAAIHKGMTGKAAIQAANSATATVVSKKIGRIVSLEMVERATKS